LSCFVPPDATAATFYREKVTGARPDRREFPRLLDLLAPGEVVTDPGFAELPGVGSSILALPAPCENVGSG
jgi:hypothetical protein